MVGRDAQVYVEKCEERACVGVCDDASMKSQALAIPNGKFVSYPNEFESPTAVADGEGIAKLATVCPITPNPRREYVTSVVVVSSPSPPKSSHSRNVDVIFTESDDCLIASDIDNNPHTPKEGVFDPFAPGLDDLLLAPDCKKRLMVSQRLVARRLDFNVDDFPEMTDDVEDAQTLLDKQFLVMMYGTLLEAIVKKQIEDLIAENHQSESNNLFTTTPPPRLTGIVDSFHGAPKKVVARKSRNIDPGLCRKLEF